MPETLRQVLEHLTDERGPGPATSFSRLHLLLALELIATKPIGRNRLAHELGVGNGAVRTIIRRLKDSDLIAMSKAGCGLSEKGVSLWRTLQLVFRKVRVHKSELTFSEYSFAALVRNGANRVKSGMEQRDAAVMAGAEGATTTLFKKGRLIFPSTNEDVAASSPRASSQIMDLLRPQEDDAIIVVSADNQKKAEKAAIAAALTLLDND